MGVEEMSGSSANNMRARRHRPAARWSGASIVLLLGPVLLAGHAQGFAIQENGRSGRWALSSLGQSPGGEPLRCERANCLVGALGDREILLGRYSRLLASGAAGPLKPSADDGRGGKAAAKSDAAPAALQRAHIDALREAIAGLGSTGSSSVALAFVGAGAVEPERSPSRAAANPQGERPDSASLGGGFAFSALAGWNGILARSHGSPGPRFGEMLYNVVDEGRLLAWSGAYGADAAEAPGAGRPPIGIGAFGSIGGGVPSPDPASQAETRTIVYVTKGHATVMVVRNPDAKK